MTVGKYQPLTLTPINFSLTDGTSIPAPPDSPPETPRPPPPSNSSDTKDAPKEELARTSTNDGTSGNLSPTSPSLSKRPGSVRKFLGLRTLSSSDSLKSERPGSPATVDTTPSLNRKKSGSWFGRRKSTMIIGPVPIEGKANGTDTSKPAKKGPPPPALPELSTFGVSEETTSLGADDLFKNIK